MKEGKPDIDQLLIKLILDEITADERKIVDPWLKVAENRAYYEKFKTNFDRLSSFRGQKTDVNIDAAWEKVSQRIEDPKVIPISSGKRSINYTAIGIAASVLLLAGLFFFFNSGESNQEAVLAETVIEHFQSDMDGAKEQLADGSSITLKKGASVEFELDEGSNERRVKLSGDAYFKVKRDTTKPFIIQAETAIIRVLGTAFLVDSEEDGHVVVSVTEGLVSLSSSNKTDEILLKKGEQGMLIDGELSKIKSTTFNPLSWITGSLRFKDARMEDVIADLEKHFEVEIDVLDEDLLDCRLTAKFNGKSLSEVMESLKLTFEIEVESTEEKVTLSGKGC